MSLLEADRRRVIEIDAKISELEATLSDLRGRKAIAQERLGAYKYPILTLPPEITSEIFTHFLPTYPDCPHPIGTFSPTHLTQICRTWRQIALGTPSLWRAIRLWPEDDDLPPAGLAEELEIWARRSGRYPMAVELEFLQPHAELISELLISIAAQRARLEHLVLQLHDADSLLPFSGPMPRLRHLDLILEVADPVSASVVFIEAPLLRTVLMDFAPARLVLPWAQLTSVTLRFVDPSACSPILEQSPNLIFCHLSLMWNDDDDGLAPNLAISLRSLTSLKLEAGPVANYLHTFTVPSLRCLETNEGFLGSDPLQYLASFISKSGCQLQELIMRKEHTISRSAYREAFPSINFSFIDGKATDGWEA